MSVCINIKYTDHYMSPPFLVLKMNGGPHKNGTSVSSNCFKMGERSFKAHLGFKNKKFFFRSLDSNLTLKLELFELIIKKEHPVSAQVQNLSISLVSMNVQLTFFLL